MRHPMMVSAYHMVENLGAGLYESEGARLWEPVKNGLVAQMRNSGKWEPRGARIDISLVPNHPLSPDRGTVLLIRDYGCGLTDTDLYRYINWLGTPLKYLEEIERGEYSGAKQKGIGRLATLALNEKCVQEKVMARVKHGYYMLTRTAKSGNVRYITIIPEKAENEGGIETDRFISPTSTEMGPLKGITGTFTALVVPNPIFRSHEEIYNAIKWFLPREQDKMFQLYIGGKPVVPPPLEKEINITSPDGRFRARLGLGDDKSDGIWLCDEETSFRVASCLKLGRLLPDPLWYPGIIGDIFGPDLLRHQNTARSTLAKEYTRKGNKSWQRLLMFLIKDVVPQARELVERDAISSDAADAVDEIVDMFRDRFGEPDDLFEPPPPRPPKSGDPKPPKPKDDEGDEGKKRERYRKMLQIKARNKTYYLYRGQTLPPHIFAQYNQSNPQIIYVNVRGGYVDLPKERTARRENAFLQILQEIGKVEHPGDPYQATAFANELRGEFLKGK